MQLEEGLRQPAVLDAGIAARTGAFLVAEGDDGERDVDARGDLERGHDAECAVETAAVRHGIEVRPEPQPLRAAAADRVAASVRLHLQPGLAHPAGRQLASSVKSKPSATITKGNAINGNE